MSNWDERLFGMRISRMRRFWGFQRYYFEPLPLNNLGTRSERQLETTKEKQQT
jgi:hypothetical protein